ncbi:MAG: hypothetical protein AUJ92_16905 [Armatimonadetes bacterium CG2_30_59_28]|nr:hypothetical protein [Armatimonadota bacterium]OIO91297.1 MAG: hypothetical protein AUJ92_16905 [Armatimonadetes bacterium CG2_30_59_28]
MTTEQGLRPRYGASARSARSFPQRGVVLVVVLWVLAILVILTWGLAATVQTEARLVSHLSESARYLESARAGVVVAFRELQDTDLAVVSPFTIPTHLSSEDKGIVLRGGEFKVNIEDESGKLNLNYTTEETLAKLTEDPDLAAAIIDWRDQDDTPASGGAENLYYLGLPDPYLARNNFFRTVDEILLVRGMTSERYYQSILGKPPLANLLTVYSVDENVDRGGQARLNLNDASESDLEERLGDVLNQQEITAIASYRAESSQRRGDESGTAVPGAPTPRQIPGGAEEETSPSSAGSTGGGENRKRFGTVGNLLSVPGLSREKVRKIADRVTTSDEQLVPGRVNINTADEAVLASLPGMDAAISRNFTAYREGEDGPFDDVGEVLELDSITPEVYRQIADLITVGSTAFRITSSGLREESATRETVECVVTMVRSNLRRQSSEGDAAQGSSRPQIIRYYRHRQ